MDMSAQVFGSLVQSERDYLYRFALTKLRNPVDAEEAVQETLLAGLESGARFEGKSTLRTWLTAILKFKIIDTHRRNAREPLFVEKFDDVNVDNNNTLYDERAGWTQAATWGNPDAELEQKRFWLLLESCLDELPPAAARAFYLSEIEGADTEVICKELCISLSNCWVILHRARAALRASLDAKWINPNMKESNKHTKMNGTKRKTNSRNISAA